METPTFQQRLDWARRQMTRLARVVDDLGNMDSVRLAFDVHLDLKMIPLVEALLARGCKVYLCSCNPATTDPQSADYLACLGATVDLEPGAVDRALGWAPTHMCELGAGLTSRLLERGSANSVVASMEGTGSGIARLAELDLPYPVLNWDALDLKRGLHNRYMVGLTAWHTFFARTFLTLHAKRVVVIGFGPVGKGVAWAARTYGGSVAVVDTDPARALEAAFEGWQVAELADCLPDAEVVVTATGASKVLRREHFKLLQDGVFLLNVGHNSSEIEVGGLRTYPAVEVLPQVEAFDLDGRTVYLLAGGSMLNLTAGSGDSLNAFDLTLSLMASTIRAMLRLGPTLAPGLQPPPRQAWEPYVS